MPTFTLLEFLKSKGLGHQIKNPTVTRPFVEQLEASGYRQKRVWNSQKRYVERVWSDEWEVTAPSELDNSQRMQLLLNWPRSEVATETEIA